MTIPPEVLNVLRCAAKEGATIAELIELSQTLTGRPYRLSAIYVFRMAFNLPIRDAKMIGGWTGFGGPVDAARLEEELGDLVRSSVR